MRILAARLRRYSIAFRAPLETSARSIRNREGIVLELQDEDGLVGRGEAAPASWVGGESLAEAGEALGLLLEHHFGRLRPGAAPGEGLARAADRASAPPAESLFAGSLRLAAPSARAALDTALLDLAAQRRRVPVACLLVEIATAALRPSLIEVGGGAVELPAGVLGDRAERFAQFARRALRGERPSELGYFRLCERVPVAALCRGPAPEELAREARELRRRGFRSFKLKVGAAEPEEDLLRIHALADAAGEDVRLRLDANRAWDLERALAVLGGLDCRQVEYVEEPLRDEQLLHAQALRVTTGIPLALDESVRSTEDLTRLAGARFGGVVLKLARIGGPLVALELAATAAGLGLFVVVTDSLESAVGRAAAVQTAAALEAAGLLGGELRAVGLGGAFVLAGDFSCEEQGPAALDSPVEPQAAARLGGPGLGLQEERGER